MTNEIKNEVKHNIGKHNSIFRTITGSLIIAAEPFLAMWLLQWYTCDPFRMYPVMIPVNALFFYILYLLLSAVFGSLRIGYAIGNLLTMILALTNYFVVSFRSSPIVPWDLLSVKTAASVADNYTYSMDQKAIWLTAGFILMILLAFSLRLKIRRIKIRIPMILIFAVMLTGYIMTLQKQEVKDYLGMDQTLFTPNVRYRNNGFIGAFVGNLDLIHIEKPKQYSPEKVEEIRDEITASESDMDADFDLAAAPNIIVVMDEAFSDLSVLGDFETSEDYMPFLHSMMKQYTGGSLQVSVKGGNTANTEYEFLSGDTMAFLPAGSVVYQQYIQDDVPTIATNLRSLGYETIAIHPYQASGWNRDTVYPRLGFSEFLDIDYFSFPEYIRNYVSDRSAFDKIMELYEYKESNDRLFIFEVTMQNHGGYSKDHPGFSPEIRLTQAAPSTSVESAEKYLTLMKYTDQAMQKMIEYFEKVEEPVVIVFFGDHQPSDYITHVIGRLTGYNADASLEESQKTYQVPFLIWNNFGLEKDQNMEHISCNYLGAYLMQECGMPLSNYQRFLLQMREVVPVLTGICYQDPEGNYHPLTEKTEENEQWFHKYQMLQYNHLIDSKHRVAGLFDYGSF